MEIKMVRFLLFTLVVCVGIELGCARRDYYVQKLVTSIFRGYEKSARPASSEERKTNVSISMSLISINSYDSERRGITIMAWLSMSWIDSRLSWDRKAYGDIHKLNIPPSDIWVPDVVMSNSLESFAPQFPKRLLATVQYNGDVYLVIPSEFKTRCTPTEESSVVTCPFKFLSWSYDGYEIGLSFRHEAIDMSSYAESPGFQVADHKTKLSEVFYPCCPEPYYDALVTLDVKVNNTSSSGSTLISIPGLSACIMIVSFLLI